MASANHPHHAATTRWSRHFSDFDEMAQHISAWDVRYEQLSCGAFQADIAMSASPRLQILSLEWNRALSNVGAAPKGRRSFAFPIGRRMPFRFSGLTANHSAVMTARGGNEFHLVTEGQFDFVIATFDLAMVDDLVRARFGGDERRLDQPRLVSAHSAAAMAAAAQALDALGHALASATTDGAARLERQAADIVLSALSPPPSTSPVTPRRRLARLIEEILRARLADPPGIGELCTIIGVPERTLHLAFHESYGMPPATYLRRLRLNAARRMLLQGRGPTVAAAAAHFGFFHFGRFSHDYATMFGEPPSTTLTGNRRDSASA